MDLATPQVRQNGSNLYVTHGEDTNLFVEFFTDAVKNIAKSESEGRPIFEDVVYISISFPGDRTKKIVRPASDEDKNRFSRHWEAFQRGETGQNIQGTRLEQWPILSRSEIAELKALGIMTVEQLAALPDSALNWFGAREYRTKALAYIEMAKDSAIVTKFAKENEELKSEIDQLKEQMKELSSQIVKRKNSKQSEE